MARPKRSRTKYPKYRHEYGSNAYSALSSSARDSVRKADRAVVKTHRDTFVQRPPRPIAVERVAFAQCGSCLSRDIWWVRISTLNPYDAQSGVIYRKAQELGLLSGCVRQCVTCNEIADLRQSNRNEAIVTTRPWSREEDDEPEVSVQWRATGAPLKPKMRLDL